MSCKKDRELQAAIALGLLWGMNQVSRAGNDDLHTRYERLKILLNYMGINLPMKVEPPDIWIGQGRLRQQDWGWVAIHDEVMEQTVNYVDSLRAILRHQVKEASAQALASLEPPDKPYDDEKLLLWAVQCQKVLTAPGGPWEGSALKLSAITTTFAGNNLNIRAYLLENHDSVKTIAIGQSVGFDDPQGVLTTALRSLTDNLLNDAARLEPFMGIQGKLGFTEKLFTSGYFSVAYVDEDTAKTIGGDAQKGWYVVRDSKLYQGPMRSLVDASQWVEKEWGTDVEQYAQIAQFNDQRRTLRQQFEQEAAQLQKSTLNEKAKAEAYKHMTKQLAFSMSKFLAPYIVSELEKPILGKYGRSFVVKGVGGELLRVSVSWAYKNGEGAKTWRVNKYYADGSTGQMLKMGHEFSVSSGWEDARSYNGPYDVLAGVLSHLIIEGKVAPYQQNGPASAGF